MAQREGVMKVLFRVSVLLFTLTNVRTNVSWGQSATAVGAAGTILRTDDGGDTWTPQDSGTHNPLSGVSLVDACTGTVVGAAGTILRTDDCGNTWNAQDSGTSVDLSGVFSVDANTAFAVGAQRTILRTDDGGAGWAPQSVPDPAPICDPGTVTFAAVSFGDANTGIAVGNCFYHPPAFNLQVSFRTSDGGATWLFNINTTVAGFLRAVSFESADTAIAVGDFMTGRITPTFGARALKTTDGGAGWVWQGLFVRPFYPVYLYGVSYVDPFTATAVGRIYLGTRWEGLIIRTINGGANWVSQPSNTSNLLSGVSFVDADNGIAVGEAGTILRTSDGGATWTSPSIGTKAELYSVSFVPSPLRSGDEKALDRE
jgi:photosystem II stability/assembly factor-like uncharacterized protein